MSPRQSLAHTADAFRTSLRWHWHLLFPPPIPADGRVCFFARDRARFGFLSNFHMAPIAMDGDVWPSTEHYYQSCKSHDPEYKAAIRAARHPGQAKRLSFANPDRRKAMKRSWFKGRLHLVREDWDEVKLDIMRAAVHAKFTQHWALARRLRATGTAVIVEDSPRDFFWGSGDGSGENWMGRLLMAERESLRITPSSRSNV